MGIANIFKQIIFDKCIFTVQKQLSKADLVGIIDHDKRLKREIADELAREILKRETIKVSTNEHYVTYHSELIVLNPLNLKIVVEAAISMLSDEQIKAIKAGTKNL